MDVAPGTDVLAQTADGQPGSYTIRELIKDVPLETDENGERAHITCVDAWNGNIYIGTSSGEVLHYVSIPSDPNNPGEAPMYIFATKIEPKYQHRQEPPDNGVKQILLLPDASKACIVCNGALTFYTLPELSPAFDGIKQEGCFWIGGVDRNLSITNGGNGTVAVICLRPRLRLIRIGEEARRLRNIELGGIRAIERRGDLACVADDQSYSLLDVVNHRKNDLSPISSLAAPRRPRQELAPPPPNTRQISRSLSSSSPARPSRGHERNVSLGNQLRDNDHLRPDLRPDGTAWPARSSSKSSQSPARDSSRETSPSKTEAIQEQTGPDSKVDPAPKPEPEVVVKLQPHIVSPTANEFLVTTGTMMSDPGVGMFVNLDGDVSRGTMEFTSYPLSIALDWSSLSQSADDIDANGSNREGYVLAIVQRQIDGKVVQQLEAQRWDVDPSETFTSKEWLTLDSRDGEIDKAQLINNVGMRVATTPADVSVGNVGTNLRLRRLIINAGEEKSNTENERRRNSEEDRFASRFTRTRANVLLYTKDRISWVIRQPLVLQLDQQLNRAIQQGAQTDLTIDASIAQSVFNSIRGQEARNELEFVTLRYVRQKASLLLLQSLILQSAAGTIAYEHDKRRAEEALVFGDLDPRIVISMIPVIQQEVIQTRDGIWIPQGLRDMLNTFQVNVAQKQIAQDVAGAFGQNLLSVMKRYLLAWRKKKGFGSVADETQVFQTVDAALLHVLLLLDQSSPRGPATAGSTRAELNDVVDHGVDCFDRAVALFEQFHRLHVLSRLYQSRKMPAQVLATWRRIIEGERDDGGELIEGEQDLRRYLTRIRDTSLVQEYGSWLAHRNPKLGVQVFADDHSKVKFQPSEAVAILRSKAPEAVKDYLEHLVFGKNHVEYVNDLIAFYLDIVLHELESSQNARATLLRSYETYRALQPPKPTYRQFITDNAIDAEWWHSRLRLLQLIGGSHGAASKYNVATLGQRLAPYSNELVPEMIILNGREGKHQEALRLLTHGLGDYDTAIRYCLLGGSSIFHPRRGVGVEPALPEKDEQARLFEYLLHEFFQIEDPDETLARTSELLERFGGWFDLATVLQKIPDTWSVEVVSGFLVCAFRRLVQEKNETIIVKALCSAQNLRQSADLIEKCEAGRPIVVPAAVDIE